MKIFDSIENKIFEFVFKKKINSLIEKDFNPSNYRYFNSIKKIQKWGEYYSLYFREIRELENNLEATKSQIEELDILNYYAGYGSEKINNHLREIPQFLINDEYVKSKILKLEKCINKFSLNEKAISIRLMPSIFIDYRYKKGNTFIEKAFLSTSLNLNYRLDYQSKPCKLKNTALLIIKMPSGINGVYTEEVQPKNKQREEYEFIIQRNSELTIESNFKIFSNRIIVMSIN